MKSGCVGGMPGRGAKSLTEALHEMDEAGTLPDQFKEAVKRTERLVIGVDFDGTIAHHRVHPDIGPPVPGAFEWMQRFKDAGAFVILWTCRNKSRLDLALSWLRENDNFQFDAVNESPKGHGFYHGEKAFAHIYIDDAAFGCPTIKPDGYYSLTTISNISRTPEVRPYVDWSRVGPMVLSMIQKGPSGFEELVTQGLSEMSKQFDKHLESLNAHTNATSDEPLIPIAPPYDR